MMNLSARDRSMLAKLLALAGSTDHEGETISAMKKADALVKSKGASWEEVLLARPIYAVPQSTPAAPEHAHVTMAQDLLRRGRKILNTWERNFLTGILAYRDLRPRQLETLALISRKVAVAAASAA